MILARDRVARLVQSRARQEYHPGNLTAFSPFRQDDAPPLSHREVELRSKPVLYDASGRPMYRVAGFKTKS